MGTRGEGFRSHGRLIALVWQYDETTCTTLDVRRLCAAVTCVRALVCTVSASIRGALKGER